MKDGLLKNLAFELKRQYDKYDRKMFFAIFYGTISQVSINDIKDFDEFITNSPIDMIHIHMCNDGSYIDVYEWDIEDFEVNDIFMKIKHKGKVETIYYYNTPAKLSHNSKIFAIRVDEDGNILNYNYTIVQNILGHYGLKDNNGEIFEHCFKKEYLNKILDIPNYGTYVFFTKKDYEKHMKERLVISVLKDKKEKIEKEKALIEKISCAFIGLK